MCVPIQKKIMLYFGDCTCPAWQCRRKWLEAFAINYSGTLKRFENSYKKSRVKRMKMFLATYMASRKISVSVTSIRVTVSRKMHWTEWSQTMDHGLRTDDRGVQYPINSVWQGRAGTYHLVCWAPRIHPTTPGCHSCLQFPGYRHRHQPRLIQNWCKTQLHWDRMADGGPS